MLAPIRRLTDAESGLQFLLLERVVGGQRPADAFVHHGEAVVRERLIIHRAPTYEKAAADIHSNGFSDSHGDHTKVTKMVRRFG
jgi:hypothetical protein